MRWKKLKLALTYSTIIAIIGTSGCLKLCKDKSNEFAENVYEYTSSFTDDDFYIAAHRGFVVGCGENTVNSAYNANCSPYVDLIELDVRLTGNGMLVAAHNNSVFEAKGDKVKISDTNYCDLAEKEFLYFPASAKSFLKTFVSTTDGSLVRERIFDNFGIGYTISPFEEILDVCGNKTILLDLKFNNDYDAFVAALVSVLSNHSNQDIILQSSSLDLLSKLQLSYPEYRYSGIVDSEEDFEQCKTFDIIAVRRNLIGSANVKEAVDDGKEVAVWTINSTDELDAVVEEFGDSYQNIIYITDYPDIISYQLHSKDTQKKKVTIR